MSDQQPEAKSRQQRERAEMIAHGGYIEGLMALADTIRSAAKEVASAVEWLARLADAEKRGAMSVLQRSDIVSIHKNIRSLLRDALLDDESRRDLADNVGVMVDELRKHLPRGTTYKWAAEEGRKIARVYGVDAPEPGVTPSPKDVPPPARARKAKARRARR